MTFPQNRTAHIAVDLMGGQAGCEGNLSACSTYPRPEDLILVGDRSRCQSSLQSLVAGGAEFVPSDSPLLGDESISQLLRHKRRSSVAVCARLVGEGRASAMVSSADTKAILAFARFSIGTLPGLHRPAITKLFGHAGGSFQMLDLGANVQCSPRMLFEFAHLGARLMALHQGEALDAKPRIAVLNIGTERGKGPQSLNAAATLLSRSEQLNFCGFLEPMDLFTGQADVVVCDGFSGNLVLKTIEGVAHYLGSQLANVSDSSGDLARLGHAINPELHNGALLAGINGIVVKSHGSTSEAGFVRAIEQAGAYLEADLVRSLRSMFDAE